MGIIRLSDLVEAATLTGSTLYVVDSDGISRKCSIANLRSFMQRDVTLTDNGVVSGKHQYTFNNGTDTVVIEIPDFYTKSEAKVVLQPKISAVGLKNIPLYKLTMVSGSSYFADGYATVNPSLITTSTLFYIVAKKAISAVSGEYEYQIYEGSYNGTVYSFTFEPYEGATSSATFSYPTPVSPITLSNVLTVDAALEIIETANNLIKIGLKIGDNVCSQISIPDSYDKSDVYIKDDLFTRTELRNMFQQKILPGAGVEIGMDVYPLYENSTANAGYASVQPSAMAVGDKCLVYYPYYTLGSLKHYLTLPAKRVASDSAAPTTIKLEATVTIGTQSATITLTYPSPYAEAVNIDKIISVKKNNYFDLIVGSDGRAVFPNSLGKIRITGISGYNIKLNTTMFMLQCKSGSTRTFNPSSLPSDVTIAADEFVRFDFTLASVIDPHTATARVSYIECE